MVRGAYDIHLIDVGGRVWELTNPASPVRVRYGGWPELSAAITQQTVGVAGGGVRLLPGGGMVSNGTGALTVGFYPDRGVNMLQLRREWVDGWAFDRYCTLNVGRASEGIYSAQLRLDDSKTLPQPQTLNFDAYFEIATPVVWDRGVWSLAQARPGPRVEITNPGVANVVVAMEWQRGGTVTMPSGATFTVPTVTEPRVITLASGLSFPVTDLSGNPDETLRKQLWGRALDERVKPGQTKTFTGPTGCVWRYNVEVKEPWR